MNTIFSDSVTLTTQVHIKVTLYYVDFSLNSLSNSVSYLSTALRVNVNRDGPGIIS